MTDQQTSRTNITEALYEPWRVFYDSYERGTAFIGLDVDTIIADDLYYEKAEAICEAHNAALAAERRSDAVTAPDEPSVVRIHYGDPDTYARAYNAAYDDVAEQYGIRDLPDRVFEGAYRYDTDDEHVLSLWADGQTWDIRWPKSAGEARAASASVPPPALDESTLARALHEHRGHLLPGACSYCEQDAHVIFGIAEVRGYAAETPEQGRGDE